MRKPLPDLLKGLAVIFMIQVHIMELFALESVYSSWTGKLSLFLGGPPAAPVFMAVMGYFLGLSQKNFRYLIQRGLKLIGLGFLLNLGLNLHLLLRIITGDFMLNPWEYVFGVDILFLAGLSIILIALLRKLFSKNIIIPLLLVLITTALPHLFSGYVSGSEPLRYFTAFLYGNYPWSYFPLIPWFSYPLTGYVLAISALRLSGIKIHAPARVFFILAISAGIIVTFPWAINITSDLSLYYHHDILFYLWVTFFLVLWVLLCELIIRKLNHTLIVRYLRWAGKNVTALYIIQWLLIGNIATAIYKTREMYQLTAWFGGILLATSLLVFAWEKWVQQRKNRIRF